MELERMSTKDTELNSFILENKINPRQIYRFFEEENLNDFIISMKEKLRKEGKIIPSFTFKEGKETNANEERNTRPGVLYKYFGEIHETAKSRHGYGFCVWADGSTYHGEWTNDIKHGYGVEDWLDGAKYEGFYSLGLKHGQGRFCWPNDDVYTGEFIHNKVQGKGLYEWANGNSYEGSWNNNKMNGHGKFTWSDDKVYIGDHVEDIRQGQGTFIWKDGSQYEGEWSQGKQHGAGTYTNSLGQKRSGEWINGSNVKWL